MRCLEFRPPASCFSTQPPSAHPQALHLTWGGRGTGLPTLRSDLALQTANGAAPLARAAACQALPELKSSRQVLRAGGSRRKSPLRLVAWPRLGQPARQSLLGWPWMNESWPPPTWVCAREPVTGAPLSLLGAAIHAASWSCLPVCDSAGLLLSALWERPALSGLSYFAWDCPGSHASVSKAWYSTK